MVFYSLLGKLTQQMPLHLLGKIIIDFSSAMFPGNCGGKTLCLTTPETG